MGLSRQAYYQRNRSADRRSEQDSLIAQVVREVRMRQPRLGTRKLHFLLHDQDRISFHVGRDRLFRVLAEHRLLVKLNRPGFPRHSPSSENSVSHTLLETAA